MTEMTDSEKYDQAVFGQQVAAMGPGEYVFVPDLKGLPFVDGKTATLMQHESVALLTFIERLGFKLVERIDGRFEFRKAK